MSIRSPFLKDTGSFKLTADLLNRYPLPVWLVETEALAIVFLNKAAEDSVLYTVYESIGTCFCDLFREENRLEVLTRLKSITNPAIPGVYQLYRKDGTLLHVTLHAALVKHEVQDYLQISAIRQVTRQTVEDQVEKDRRRYRAYIESCAEGIFCQEYKTPVSIRLSFNQWVACTKSSSFITDCNIAFARMHGFSAHDAIKGVKAGEVLQFHNRSTEYLLKTFYNNGFKLTSAEVHEPDKTGQSNWYLYTLLGIVANDGLKRIWGTKKDITAEKLIHDKIRLLANLVGQTSDVLTTADLDFRPTTWNKAAEQIYGLKAEDVLGKNLGDLISLSYYGHTRNEVRELIASSGNWRGECYFVRPTDGAKITLLIRFKQLSNDSGEPTGYLITGTDITERKAAESRLQESENRFREVADSAPVMIWMSDENNGITYLNKKWLDFTGVDITGYDSSGWTTLVHPEDLQEAKKDYDIAFAGRQQIVLIYRLRTRDGNYRWVHDVSVPRFLADGTFVGYIGSLVDIEDEMQDKQQLLYQATILENVSDVIVTTDLQFKVRGWNRVAEQYYGITEAEALGKNMRDLVRFQYYGTTAEQAASELQQNGIWRGEVSFTAQCGEVKYFLHTVKYVFDERGNKLGFLDVGHDITDRKKIEQKLLKSETFYRTLIADSLDGILLMNTEGQITFCSPSVKHVLGYDVEDVVGRNAFEFVHTEDVSWAFQSFQKEMVEEPEVKFIAIRLLKKDGTWLWCNVRGHNLLRNPALQSIVIYFHDDTVRKQAREELKESEKRFRTLVRDLQVGVFLADKDGYIQMCNKGIADMLSLPEQVIVGKNVYELMSDNMVDESGNLVPREARPMTKAISHKRTVKDHVVGVQHPVTRKRFWILVNANPVLDNDGTIRHVVCSVMDITERKTMEQELLSKKITHQKQLTQASIDGQEKERREIGKELHDNIGQQLTTIKLFLDLAKTTADENTLEMINMSLRGVGDVINEVRAMSRALVPYTLKDLGLVESITDIVDSISRAQLIHIQFDVQQFDEAILHENQQLALFRIVQEQLNNIVKHAEAQNIHINLQGGDEQILLMIKDDGKGFKPETVRKGLGITNITNRMELFGGKAELESTPGKGCQLRLVMPLKPVDITS